MSIPLRHCHCLAPRHNRYHNRCLYCGDTLLHVRWRDRMWGWLRLKTGH